MSERTLLLDQGYQPVTTISWQRAICLLTLGKVEVIEAYDKDVRSTHLVFKVPAVVRLVTRFMRSKQRVKFSRPNVLARDKWTCQYCGQRKPTAELTYDHVVPRALGGKTCWENIVTACKECNSMKADRTVEQARAVLTAQAKEAAQKGQDREAARLRKVAQAMRLRCEPERPNWVPVFSMQISTNSLPDSWRSYCEWAVAKA